MKLKFVNSLTEADVDKGKLLNVLAEIHKTIKTAVEAKQYSFKDEQDRGFYILPKFGYLAKIQVQKSGEGYKVTLFNAQGVAGSVLDVGADVFMDTWKSKICPAVINSLIKADADEDAQLQEAFISETAPNLNIFKAIKNSLDKKAAAEDVNIKGLIKPCQDILETLIADKAKKNSIKIKATAANEMVEFALNSNFIVGAIYNLDQSIKIQGGGNIIKVVGYVTSLGENRDVRCSLVTFTRFLNKKLGLNIQLKDEKLLAATGASKEVIAKVNDFETELKDTLGDDVIKLLEEGLNEDLTNDYIKYDKALEQIQNDEEKGEALVKIFFYRQTDKKIKLSDEEAKIFYQSIDKVKSFDINKSLILNIVFKYFNKNKASSTIEEEIKNLIYVLTANNYVEKLKNIDDFSLIYNSEFMKADIESTATQEICDKHTAVRKNYSVSSIKKINLKLTQIRKKIPNIIVPDRDSIKTATDLANFMVFKDENTVRDLAEIKAIYSIIVSSDFGAYEQPIDNQPTSKTQIKANIEPKDVDKVKELIANIDSNASIETIRRKLNSQFMINPKIKAVLAQLLAKNENSNI